MPLIIAIKNRKSVVVASDTTQATNQPGAYGQLMPLPARCVLLMAGNIEAVRHAVEQTALPEVRPEMGAAGVAQLVQAALVVELVPKLSDLKGRVELIVAGIDRVRHTEEPGLYYMDSAQDFRLEIPEGDVAVGGATAAVTALTAGHTYAESTVDQLKVLAKECFSSTKMRWPQAVGTHVEIAVVAAGQTQVQVY